MFGQRKNISDKLLPFMIYITLNTPKPKRKLNWANTKSKQRPAMWDSCKIDTGRRTYEEWKLQRQF